MLKVAKSQKAFHFGSNLQKSQSIFFVDSTQESVLAPFLGDWRQSEKLSEIEPPLVCLPLYTFI